MNEPIRIYCCDCRFAMWSGNPSFVWFCLHPSQQRDIVNGQAPTCKKTREIGTCGPSGALFQRRQTVVVTPIPPRVPFWRRFFGWVQE